MADPASPVLSGDPALFRIIGELFVQTKIQDQLLVQQQARIAELEPEEPPEEQPS